MKPLTHAIPGALGALLREAPLSPQKVAFAWTAAVGPAIDRVTSVRLEGTRLLVDVQGDGWNREVTRMRSMILPRLQSLLGTTTVTSIEVRR